MAIFISLLSQIYISNDEMNESLKNVSGELKLNFHIDSTSNYKCYAVRLSDVYGLDFRTYTAERYEELKNLLYSSAAPDYGTILGITIYSYRDEDDLAIPFIKKLLEIYPECIVSSEENNDAIEYFYTKSNFDNYAGNNIFNTLFENPPQGYA